MHRLLAGLIFALPAAAQCRLPDVAPDALSRLTPEQLIEAGHYLRAEQILDPFVKTYPDDAPAVWLLSRAKAALGELEDALQLAESAVAADPPNASYHVQVAAVAGRLAEKASLLKQLGYVRRARQELDAALAIDERNADALWGMMMYYFAAPPLLGGDKNKAAEIGERIASFAPDPGRYYQARLALQMKDPDQAEVFLRQAELEDPLSFDVASALANLYMDQKPDQARAEKWACQAVHADPTRADAWALLARARTMCGCWTEAIETARHAEAIDGENQVAWYAIASAAVARGEQLEMAVNFLRKYLAQPVEGGQPTAAQAHEELGFALSKLGREVEAIAELKTALEQDSTLESAKAEIKRLRAGARK